MRLKLIDRLLLTLLLIVLAAACIGAIAFGFLAIPEAEVIQRIHYVYSYWANSLIIVGVSLFVLVLILILLYNVFIRGRSALPPSIAVSSGEHGSVNLAMNTLSDIIVRNVMAVDKVVFCRDTILPKEEGLEIMLRVTLAEDTQIPEKTQEIQVMLKENVLRLTGLKVNLVHVMVDQQPAKKPEKQ